MTKNFLPEMRDRGYFFQAANLDDLENILNNEEELTCYIGFDCTAKSLHVGSMVQIMTARMIQNYGHKIIILLGGGTTQIGDPSGKDETRKMLSVDEIESNAKSIKKILLKFINEDKAIFVNNADWLQEIKYIDFLRDIAPHFSVNRMLEFESVKSRLERESHLSFLEFNYPLLQAYDFVELNKRYNCRLQVGGSDQWGNIVSGIELGRRLGLPKLYGITTPLVTTSSGKKMGKTASGAIWLDEDLVTPYEYWQYFRNLDDSDIIKFLKLFTSISLNEIHDLENDFSAGNINEVKKILATETTKICHGQKNAEDAAKAAISEFEQGDSSNLPIQDIGVGDNLVQVLIALGFASSNSEAKRLVRNSGVKINDIVIKELDYHFNDGDKISVGKRKTILNIKS